MKKPLVSIVLPTYNGERYLPRAIASCLEQSYAHLEILLVNDGSTNPATAEILEAQDDPRLRVLNLPENQGLPEALNAGMEATRGDYISWTSDDNAYRPEAIARMVETVESSGADFVYAAATVVNDDDQTLGALIPKPPDQLPLSNCVGACFLYRRKVLEKIGRFNPELRLAEDYDYWIRVSRHFKMERLDEDLYVYRQHKSNLTNQEGLARVEQMVDRARFHHFSPREIQRAEGLRAERCGDRAKARKLLMPLLLTRPWDASLWKPWLLSVLPPTLVKNLLRLKGKK